MIKKQDSSILFKRKQITDLETNTVFIYTITKHLISTLGVQFLIKILLGSMVTFSVKVRIYVYL